jgi:ATP-dependent DNA helicase RecQ
MVLVVSPLISLMEDQVGRARKAGLRADFLSSATPAGERRPVVDRALSGETDMLLVAPERFLVPGFRALLPRLPVSLLAVDEAHCIAQWGHDFRPAYLRIGDVRPQLPVPVLALTATATPRVREEMASSLRLRRPRRVVGSFDRPNLAWEVVKAGSHGDKIRTVRGLLRAREGATIIYASTRRSVEAVRRALASRGILATAYHAGLSPDRRTEVQARFLEDPAPVVVATNAFGMGIDRPDVRMVVHYQLSGSLEAYYQEAGRAGRDGGPARCIGLWGSGDRRIHDAFVSLTHPEDADLRKLLRWIVRTMRPGHPTTFSAMRIARALRLKGGEDGVLGGLRALSRVGAVILEDDSLTLLHPEPDLSALAPLRRISRAQVASVERYAREGGCRRRKLLEYFGESVLEPRCHRCDRCSRTLGYRIGEEFRRASALFGGGGNR